jgi:hypothetical protein
MILKLIPSDQITNGSKQRRHKFRPQKDKLTRERLRIEAEWKVYATVRKTDKEKVQNSADKHTTKISSEVDISA